MLAVVQRVREASVVVGGRTVGAIAQGLLVLVCASAATARRRRTGCWPSS